MCFGRQNFCLAGIEKLGVSNPCQKVGSGPRTPKITQRKIILEPPHNDTCDIRGTVLMVVVVDVGATWPYRGAAECIAELCDWLQTRPFTTNERHAGQLNYVKTRRIGAVSCSSRVLGTVAACIQYSRS